MLFCYVFASYIILMLVLYLDLFGFLNFIIMFLINEFIFADLQSLVSLIICRFFMKLFTTKSIEPVKYVKSTSISLYRVGLYYGPSAYLNFK